MSKFCKSRNVIIIICTARNAPRQSCENLKNDSGKLFKVVLALIMFQHACTAI